MSIGILGHGVYSFSEASRLTGLSTQRVRAWFTTGWSDLGPVVRSDYADKKGTGNLLGFLDLIDALVVGQLRKLGLSLQYLRKVYIALTREFQTNHPFSWKGLYTDGKVIFIRVAKELNDEELKEIVSRQQAFPEVLLPYLDQLDYDPETLLARRWNIFPDVVIDPSRRYGKPIVASSGLPTAILAKAFYVNGEDAESVGEWYGVDVGQVRTAVEFERKLVKVA